MSTFLDNFDSLIAEFPEERAALHRLGARFAHDATALVPPPSYPANRIFDVAKPKSGRALVSILTRLCELGILSRFIRVESDAMGSIQDFESVLEVPDVLFDDRQGIEIEVRSDQLKLYYGLLSGN